MGGFNLHAGVRVEAGEIATPLERLCRYMARACGGGGGERAADGNVAYRVKAPRSGAATTG
nr:hypothetical protein [Deltaproteobacteria bacterium]